MRSGRGWCDFAQQIEGVTSFSAAPLAPVGWCDHAAGGFYTTLTDPRFWNASGVSVHFAIGRNGEIAQIINLFAQAWGQGRIPDDSKVSWPPYNAMGRRNPNGYLVSTEHTDWELRNGVATAVPGSQWTDAEYAADIKVKRWVRNTLAAEGVDVLRFGIDSLAGHHMFDPRDRAECPGRFWREQYRQRLFSDLTSTGGEMANINQDGSQRWVPNPQNPNQMVLYNQNIPIRLLGSSDGTAAGREAWNFGGVWQWWRHVNDDGSWDPVGHLSEVEGD